MARVPRKERARREAISSGLRRYWRQVHKIEQARQVPVRVARQEIKEVRLEMRERKLSFTAALAQFIEMTPRPGFIPPDPEGEVAFNLQDRDKEQGFNLFERFREQDEVRIAIVSEFRATPGSEPEIDRVELVFSPGANKEEFWNNYFEAVRTYYKEWLDEQGVAPRTYEGFAIFVSGMQ